MASHSVDAERCDLFFSGYACQAIKQGGYSPWDWGVTVLGVGVLQSLGLGCYGPWGAASPFDYRTHLALLLRLGRGAPPAEGRGGLGPLSAGASPAAAASLSALPSQYSLHSCCGSSASMASVNCTGTQACDQDPLLVGTLEKRKVYACQQSSREPLRQQQRATRTLVIVTGCPAAVARSGLCCKKLFRKFKTTKSWVFPQNCGASTHCNWAVHGTRERERERVFGAAPQVD